mmetsp:Transcript_22150/g.39015  ORF Transcript_22150/g.39015 Transcript_22150/m.39015 type:complete len:702 (+) Transcript_22150:70-2175(+)
MRPSHCSWHVLWALAWVAVLPALATQPAPAAQTLEVNPGGAVMHSKSTANSVAGLVRREMESPVLDVTSNEQMPQVVQSTQQPSSEIASQPSNSSDLLLGLDAQAAQVRHKRNRDEGPKDKRSWSDDSLRTSLLHVSGWLKEFGLQHVLVGGTALGMLRHGDVIDGDDDVDIAVNQSDIKKAYDIVSAYGEAHGVRISHVTYNVSGGSEMGTGFRITFADINNPLEGQIKGDRWGPVDIYGFEEFSQELCLSPFNRLVNKSWLFPVSWQHAGSSKDTVPMPQDSQAFVRDTFGDDWQTPKHRGKDKPRFAWKCCYAGPVAELGTRLLAAGESCKGNFGPSGGFCCSAHRRTEAGTALLLLVTLTAASFAAFVTLRHRPAPATSAGWDLGIEGIWLLTFYSFSYLLWSSVAYVTRLGKVSIGLMVLAGQFLKITISLGLWVSEHGRLGQLHWILYEERRRLWTFVMPAALSALADLLTLDAMQHFDPAFFAALFGARAFIMAGVWRGLFHQHLERSRWLAFAAISVGCLLKLREVSAPPAQERSFVIQVFIASALNAMANLQREWLVQMEPKDCIKFQGLVISVMGLAFTFPSLCIWVGKEAVIESFTLHQMHSLIMDPFALIQVMAFAAVGLTGGHVVGQLSNIQHEVALGFFALLAVPVSFALFEHAVGRWSFLAMQLLALAVVSSTRSFAQGKGESGTG